MRILLKLDYANFGVANLFLSKVIEEKPLDGSPPPPPPQVNEGLRLFFSRKVFRITFFLFKICILFTTLKYFGFDLFVSAISQLPLLAWIDSRS